MTYAVGLQRALQHISEQMLRFCEACPVSDAMQAELNKSLWSRHWQGPVQRVLEASRNISRHSPLQGVPVDVVGF